MGILVLLTKDNKKLTVNMAMGYTGVQSRTVNLLFYNVFVIM